MVIAGCLEYNFATSIMFKPENVSPVAERFRGVACSLGGHGDAICFPLE